MWHAKSIEIFWIGGITQYPQPSTSTSFNILQHHSTSFNINFVTWAIKNTPIPSHYTSWLIGFFYYGLSWFPSKPGSIIHYSNQLTWHTNRVLSGLLIDCYSRVLIDYTGGYFYYWQLTRVFLIAHLTWHVSCWRCAVLYTCGSNEVFYLQVQLGCWILASFSNNWNCVATV